MLILNPDTGAVKRTRRDPSERRVGHPIGRAPARAFRAEALQAPLTREHLHSFHRDAWPFLLQNIPETEQVQLTGRPGPGGTRLDCTIVRPTWGNFHWEDGEWDSTHLCVYTGSVKMSETHRGHFCYLDGVLASYFTRHAPGGRAEQMRRTSTWRHGEEVRYHPYSGTIVSTALLDRAG